MSNNHLFACFLQLESKPGTGNQQSFGYRSKLENKRKRHFILGHRKSARVKLFPPSAFFPISSQISMQIFLPQSWLIIAWNQEIPGAAARAFTSASTAASCLCADDGRSKHLPKSILFNCLISHFDFFDIGPTSLAAVSCVPVQGCNKYKTKC